MEWNQILSDSGLSEREVSVVNVLAGKPSMKASEVAKELGVTRLDQKPVARHWQIASAAGGAQGVACGGCERRQGVCVGRRCKELVEDTLA